MRRVVNGHGRARGDVLVHLHTRFLTCIVDVEYPWFQARLASETLSWIGVVGKRSALTARHAGRLIVGLIVSEGLLLGMRLDDAKP